MTEGTPPPSSSSGEVLRVRCSGCGTWYRIRGRPAPGTLRCRRCQVPISLDDAVPDVPTPVRPNPSSVPAPSALPRARESIPPRRTISSPVAIPAETPSSGIPVLPTRPATSSVSGAFQPPTRATTPTPSLPGAGSGTLLNELQLAGLEVGGCRVEEIIGKGGMGVVYRATHLALQRQVAMKVLARGFAAEERQVARFLREGRSLARLNHPNVARIHQIDSFNGLHYIIMEFVSGQDLEKTIEGQGAISPELGANYMAQSADALAAAHAVGVIHRDVKPANLLLGEDGIIKITDFGLARDFGAGGGLTRTGQIVGTPHFMSPEQGEGKPLDQRSDIYSLGLTLYYLVTGRKPFEGDSPIAVMVSHIKDHPVPAHEVNPNVPPELTEIIDRMIAKSPEDRYPGMEAVASSLRDLYPVPAARHSIVGSVSGIAVPTVRPPSGGRGSGTVCAPTGPADGSARPGARSVAGQVPRRRPRSGAGSTSGVRARKSQGRQAETNGGRPGLHPLIPVSIIIGFILMGLILAYFASS